MTATEAELTPAPRPTSGKPLLEVRDLEQRFPISRGLLRAPTEFVHAVDGISFDIAPGESLGLVGESGCGKSTTGRMLVKLMEPTGGNIILRDGDYERDVANVRSSEIKEFRRRAQMIFQDPYESMNPRRTIFDTVSEPMAVQKVGTVPEREGRVLALLRLVGLVPAVVMSSPSKLMDPDVGSMRRSTQRAVVDFPQPDSPTRANVSPASRSKEMPSTAFTAPTSWRNTMPERIG